MNIGYNSNMEEQDQLAVTIGKNLTRLRKLANMTQLELAEKLNYSDKSVSKWEQGNGIPDVRILMQLAELFGVSIDDLVKEHDERRMIPRNEKRKQRLITVLLSVGLCWLVAVVVFVGFLLFGSDLKFGWLSFIYAVPASSIIVLVFSCVWHWKWIRVMSVSLLIWSVISCFYLTALVAGYNAWQLFLIGIPLQVLALFFLVWLKRTKLRE